jgi:hypothetical protein
VTASQQAAGPSRDRLRLVEAELLTSLAMWEYCCVLMCLPMRF